MQIDYEKNLDELQNKIVRKYLAKTPKSKKACDKARESLIDGISTRAKFFTPYPIYLTHGRGSKAYDLDGNEYIDYFCSCGPLLLGHCHPDVMEAIEREMKRGLLLFNLDLAAECAQLLKEVIPCAEKVRFANSGTEAIMSATRIARGVTGKNKIVKFYGHYHGQSDQFLIADGLAGTKVPGRASLGVPKEFLQNTVLLEYNDIDAVRRTLDEDNDIAGVILDPVMAAGGIFAPRGAYLKELRQLTQERGVILIFDEVISSFRLALGGAQEYFGVTPDLAILSKGLSSGAKLAALVGKEDIMNIMSIVHRSEQVFVSGTYNDGTIGLAAAIATINAYKRLNERGEYRKLHQLAEKLRGGIERAFAERGVGCHVHGIGPVLRVFFTEEADLTFDAASNLDKRVPYAFLLSMINEGILLSCPASGVIFLSFAHTQEDVQRTLDAVNFVSTEFGEVLQGGVSRPLK